MAKGKQGVPIKLGNKTYYLKLTMDVFLKAEQSGGRNWLHPRVYMQPNTQETLTIAHAAMQRENPELTFDEVAGGITPREMIRLTDAIAEAFKEDMPDPKPDSDPLAQTEQETAQNG